MNSVQVRLVALLGAAALTTPALAQTTTTTTPGGSTTTTTPGGSTTTTTPGGSTTTTTLAGDLACYKVKDRAKRGVFALTLTNAGVTQTCRVKVPAKLGCLGTAISGVVPTLGAAGDVVICYALRCPRPFPAAAQMTDGFGGQRVVNFKKAQLVCAPAAATPVSFTTTTTVPSGPCDFNSDERKCEGTCGNGGRCSAVVSGGACECRTTACGDADSPECEGFCAPDEACIFTLTDCSCVSIP